MYNLRPKERRTLTFGYLISGQKGASCTRGSVVVCVTRHNWATVDQICDPATATDPKPGTLTPWQTFHRITDLVLKCRYVDTVVREAALQYSAVLSRLHRLQPVHTRQQVCCQRVCLQVAAGYESAKSNNRINGTDVAPRQSRTVCHSRWHLDLLLPHENKVQVCRKKRTIRSLKLLLIQITFVAG